MARFNFEFEREVKRPADRSKLLRVVFLFCLVAAVTAAVIYFIIPKKDPVKAVDDKTPQNEAVSPETSGEKAPVSDGKTQSVPADKPVAPDADKPVPGGENSDIPGSETGDEPVDKPADTPGDTPADTPASGGGEAAKYDPSSSELLKHTDSFREALNDGSWKKQKDVITYQVAAGDSLERLARKYCNTVQFLKKANNITNVNSIRIGQKIFFLRAESWQITISRSKAELQVDRIINGQPVPMAVFPCRIRSGKPLADMVVSRRFSDPDYVDGHGRKFIAGSEGNPYGEGLLTLASAASPDRRLRVSIHGQGDAPAVEKSVSSGGIALHNNDIRLLYLLVPEKTPVKIVE